MTDGVPMEEVGDTLYTCDDWKVPMILLILVFLRLLIYVCFEISCKIMCANMFEYLGSV